MFCIYRTTNLVNGKTYIGKHKYKKLNDKYIGSGKLIRLAIKKYGKENFKKEILYSNIQYKETVDDMERFAIAKERAIGKGEYNLADGGDGSSGLPAWNKGKKMSEEYRKKLSEYNKAHNIIAPSQKGKRWFNNGEKNIMSFECPEGFVPGRIYQRKKGDK